MKGIIYYQNVEIHAILYMVSTGFQTDVEARWQNIGEVSRGDYYKYNLRGKCL